MISIASTVASGRAIVSDTAPVTGLAGPLADGDLWFQGTTSKYYVYYLGAWVEVSGGSEGGGGGAVESVNGQTGVVSLDLEDLANVDTDVPAEPLWSLQWDGVEWVAAPSSRSILTARGACCSGLVEARELAIGTPGQALVVGTNSLPEWWHSVVLALLPVSISKPRLLW